MSSSTISAANRTRSTDIRLIGASLWFLPVQTRIPLKFGAEVLTSITCARVRLTVVCSDGRRAQGWGETPLSVQWVWPNDIPYTIRHERLKSFCGSLAERWSQFPTSGHPMEIGHAFLERDLPDCRNRANASVNPQDELPWLAALVCNSPFDIALHDAYGNLHGVPAYNTYSAEWMGRDLSTYLEPAEDARLDFTGKYPSDFLVCPRPDRLRAWHMVGGLDLLGRSELTGDEPADGYPVILTDWVQRDGIKCLKIKLRGNDAVWDYERTVRIGTLGIPSGVEWLSVDFNCTVTEPGYVNEILDKLMTDHPRIYGMVLYVEQPFPYELETNFIDVHSVSARKPLFMDESAHDWRMIRMGREGGWSSVALKTCKTQTGAILSLCWAKAHGMTLMVQDLTNPMIAQIPHVLLAAHAGTIMGVETNAMQFYPEASRPEAEVHPGLYTRRNGEIDLSTISGSGFGYRLTEIHRDLPTPAITVGE